MLLQQKSAQMGNNLAEQQVNNNNKAKTKLQKQEQLSSPLSQVLKTYDFGNFENCEQNTEISLESVINTKEPPFSCRIMYLWSIVILLLPPVKQIFHFKWWLIGNVVGFFILPTAGYESLTLFLYVS